jgi:hypothetical protein
LFSKPRELQINDEQDSSIAEISVFDFQREESHDDPILDLAELLERSIKRTSCQKKFCLYKRKRKTQETEKLQPFLGTWGLTRLASHIVVVSNINTEPFLFDEANKLQDVLSLIKNGIRDCS